MKELYDRQRENQKYQVEMLSYIINDESLYVKSIDIIRPEMFTDINRQIFDAYVSLVAKNKKPDVTSLSRESNVELEKVMDVALYYPGVATNINNLLYELYQHMAADKYMKLANFLSNQVNAGTESDIIKEHVIKELRSLDFGSSSNVITMQEGVTRLYKIIENNRKSVNCTGVPVGIKVVDKHMGGLQKGDLIILAGEISHAKTSLALSMMYNSSVKFGERCGIISHEMTPDQITARLSAISTGLPAKHLLTGKLEDREIELFGNMVQPLIKSNIIIQDFIKRELDDTIASIRLMVLQHGVKWVVVENAGNINVKSIKNNDEARTAEISKGMKAIALELNITVILISHLNRDGGNKKQPELHRLKHSGQLEADADVVMFIYRPELHGHETFSDAMDGDISDNCEGRCKVYIAKGRNYGLVNTFPYFNHETLYVHDNEITQQEYSLNPNLAYNEPTF